MSDTTERYGWSVADWCAAAGVSRATLYNLLKAGQIESVTYCRKRIIRTHPAAWLDSLGQAGKTGSA